MGQFSDTFESSPREFNHTFAQNNDVSSSSSPQHKLKPEDQKRLEVIEGVLKDYLLNPPAIPKKNNLEGPVFSLVQMHTLLTRNLTKLIWNSIFNQKALAPHIQDKIVVLAQQILAFSDNSARSVESEENFTASFSNVDVNTLTQQRIGELFHEIISIVETSDKAIYLEVIKFALKNDKTYDCVLDAIDTLFKKTPAFFLLRSEDFTNLNHLDETDQTKLRSEQGQNFLFQIVVEIIRENPLEARDVLSSLAIEKSTEQGLRDLKEVIKLVAIVYPKLVPSTLALLEITDQKTIIELTKFVAEKNPNTVSEKIKEFGIDSSSPEGQIALTEIATIVAKVDGDTITKTIEDYGITDLKILREIAQIAFFNSKRPSVNWQVANFGITDQQTLIPFVRALGLKHPEKIPYFISEFNIVATTEEGQAVLRELALMTANVKFGVISSHIKKFKIDPTTKEGLAILVQIAKHEAGYANKMADFINDYGIKDSEILIEIAVILLTNHNSNGFLKNLKNFGIDPTIPEGQATLVTIVKKAATQNSSSVIPHIDLYPIKDEKDLIEIAKIVAQDPTREAGWIENFSILDEQKLIEIARIAAVSNPKEFSAGIYAYRIKDQVALIELALIVARLDGDCISKCIHCFGIDTNTEQGQAGVIAIANRAIKTSGYSALQNVRQFEITTLKDKLRVYAKALLYCSSEKMKDQSFSTFFPEEDLDHFLDTVLKDNPSVNLLEKNLSDDEEFRELIIKAIQEFSSEKLNFSVSEIINKICLQKNLQIKNNLKNCFVSFLFACQSNYLNEKQIQTLLVLQNFLLEFRNPSLRNELQDQLNECLADPNFVKDWVNLFEKSSSKKQSALPCLLFAPYKKIIGDDFFVKQIAPLIKHSFFKDSNRLNSLIISLKTLFETSNLSLEEKKELLQHIFGPNTIPGTVLKNAQQIFHLISFRQFARLKKVGDANSIEKALKDLFIQELGISEIDEFSQKFLATFATFRQPNAPFEYVVTLKRLVAEEQKPVISLFSEYVTHVLEGTFHENRYNVDRSVHLQEVFKERPVLEKQWKQGHEFSIESLMSSSVPLEEMPKAKAFDFLMFFEHKILLDNHFPQALVHLVVEVLKDPRLRESQLQAVQKQLGELKEKLKLQGKEVSQEVKESDVKEMKLLSIQQEMLKLLTTNLSSEEILAQVIKLSSLIGEISKINKTQYEFINDLNGLQEGLKAAKTVKEEDKLTKWKVVDTDDPCDLLMLGTEVAGSCQRINGDPNLNKCLVAYLMDGKNRALVIKDETGKIIARSVLRLLIDSETKQPILFQERIYPDILDESLLNILNKACVERAKQLELPLFSMNEECEIYHASLISLGGCAPFEYVDAASGVTPNSIFEIHEARIMGKNVS